MNKKGKIIGLSLVAIMVVSLFAAAIPSITAIVLNGDKPDLVITDIQVVGNRIQYTIENIGTVDAPTSYTGLYINGIYRARDRVDPLAPGEESDEEFAGYNYRGGEIEVCADYQNRIEDEDEENNCRGGLPDLVIIEKHETVDPDTCEFTVHFTVCNVGADDAGASVACVYVDGEQVGEVDVGPLAAGECSDELTSGPYECTPCEIVTIAVEADNYNEVDECNEENNFLENEFHCPAPDLEITDKFETVNPDDCTFTVTYTVHNDGNCIAGESWTTIWIDGDPVWEDPVGPLAPCESYTNEVGPFEFECIPCTTVMIGVEADNEDDVEECDEENNFLWNEFHCPAPDLIITNKHETLDVDTCTFTVTYTVKNVGNCMAGASITRTTVDVVTDNYDTPALGPQQSVTHTTATGFNCVPGGVEVTVTADIDDDVWECTEDNNEVTNTNYCCPDLIITEKEETVDVDACTFTVTYTVKNIGNCKAGPSTTRTSDGTDNDDFATPALAPGAEIEHTTATAFDCDPDGSVITVTADNEDDVDECDETNNEFWNEFLCCPDLIITDKEEVVDVDTCTFTVTYTVKNIGNCKAGASTTTTTVDGVDDEFATPELDPEEEVEHTTATAFDCVPGGVEVTVTADSAGDVDECDEGNNEMTNIAICLCEPDLVITDIWVVGNRIHYTIENIGGEPAPRSYTGLWINDNYRARDHVDPLAPGEESEEEFARENYEGGEIRVCADYQDRIEEANEGNNCNWGDD